MTITIYEGRCFEDFTVHTLPLAVLGNSEHDAWALDKVSREAFVLYYLVVVHPYVNTGSLSVVPGYSRYLCCHWQYLVSR